MKLASLIKGLVLVCLLSCYSYGFENCFLNRGYVNNIPVGYVYSPNGYYYYPNNAVNNVIYYPVVVQERVLTIVENRPMYVLVPNSYYYYSVYGNQNYYYTQPMVRYNY